MIRRGLSKQHFLVPMLVANLNVSCSCTVISLEACNPDSNICCKYTEMQTDRMRITVSRHIRYTNEDLLWFLRVLPMLVLSGHQTSKHVVTKNALNLSQRIYPILHPYVRGVFQHSKSDNNNLSTTVLPQPPPHSAHTQKRHICSLVEQHFIFIKCQNVITNSWLKRATVYLV